MKRLYTMLLLAVLSAASFTIGAKTLGPAVTSITFCGNDSLGNELTADFTKGSDDVWRLSNYTVSGGTEFQLKLHINFNGDEFDQWYGCPSNGDSLIRSAAQGTIVWCDLNPDNKNWLIGHSGEFTFTLSYDHIDELCFGFEGYFEAARFLTGEFNNWGETQFTTLVDEYTLNIDSELEGTTMSGQFMILDQDYNYYGVATDDDYYTITEDNSSVNLAISTDAQPKKNLNLANEGSYSFTVTDGNVLTIGNWPVETITASLVGSTQQGWDISNATVIPLTQDENTYYYTAANIPIPAGFNCQVLKHSSLSSVNDMWYGGTEGNDIEIPNGGDDFDLTPSVGDNFTFTDNGKFTISVAPDFSEAKIYGIYTPADEYFLIGDFNNWDRDNKVPFINNNDGTDTLTHTFAGEFLIMDEYGNELGGATDEDHYLLREGWPKVMLFTSAQAPNMKNIYVKDESEYTLTIANGELTVSGWPEDTGIISTLPDVKVVSVKYVNPTGHVSAKPFEGFNIVVTTNSDGTTTTSKVIR